MNKKEQKVETSKEAAIVGNTVLAVVAIDAQKNFTCKEELYANWYYCPNCDNNNVLYHDNYCSKCGCKFEWSGDYR